MQTKHANTKYKNHEFEAQIINIKHFLYTLCKMMAQDKDFVLV